MKSEIWIRLSEVVDSVKSLNEFLKVNNIKPAEIIVIWDERIK